MYGQRGRQQLCALSLDPEAARLNQKRARNGTRVFGY